MFLLFLYLSDMFSIEISEKIKQACPDFKGAGILCDVKNVSYNEALESLMNPMKVLGEVY